MKKTPLARGSKQLKRTPFKAKTANPLKKRSQAILGGKKPHTRPRLPTVKSMRKKCDDLLTPIIKKMYPCCILTGEPTEVAHHHIKKSESSSCRYYLPNLIPLTHKAHMALHSHETMYSSRIVAIKGIEWWEDLERQKRIGVKTDVHFYIEHFKILTEINNSL